MTPASNSPALVFKSKRSTRDHQNNNNYSNMKDYHNIKVSTISSLGTPIAHSSSTFSSMLRDQQQQQNQQRKPSSRRRFPPTWMFKHSFLNPRNHLSFVALCLGFLLIWVCVMSGLLLSDSLTDKSVIEDAEEIFNGHQDFGKVLFALGHEMVSTVDLLLSLQESRPDSIGYLKEALQITWDMTDVIVTQVMARNHMKMTTALSVPFGKWMEFRMRSTVSLDPREAVNLYLLISRDLERHYMKYTPSSLTNTNGINVFSPSTSVKTPFVNTGVSYSLFNSGMFMRFGEIALGTCYVRSYLMINHTEYLELQFTSKALIESAFQFHPRAQQKYYEIRASADGDDQLEEVLSKVRQDMLTGGRSRNTSKLAHTYLEGVKNEIAQLLLTKDYLNSTIWNQIKQVNQSNRSSLVFAITVTVIALLAILSSLLLLCCSIRSVAQAAGRPSRERIVYKANTLLRNQQSGGVNQFDSLSKSHGDLRARSQTLPSIDTIFNPFNIGVPVDRPSSNQPSNQPHSLRGQGVRFSNLPPSSPPFNFNNDKLSRCFF